MLNQHHHPTHHIILTQGSKIVFSILLKNTNILVLIRSDFFGYISGPKLFENFQSCTDSSPPIQIVFCQSKEKLSLKCAKENRLLVSLQANPNGWSDVWSGVNFFLEKMQFSSCQLNSRAHITTGGVHIWREKIFVQTLKNVCAHLEKERKICAHLEKYLCTFGNRFVHIWKKICWGFCNLHLCRHGRIMMLVAGYLEVISGCKAAIQDYSSYSRVRTKYIVSKCISTTTTTRLDAQYVRLNLPRWDRTLSKISAQEMNDVCYCASL